MKTASAVAKINRRGALLVFPVNNFPEPASLWSEFYPRSEMRWEWDEDGDDRVAELWQLMKKLSAGGQVVYSKWYQGRATFFSRELFAALVRLRGPVAPGLDTPDLPPLSRPAREILEALENDSPLSTKQLKKLTGLQGRENEAAYNRALKELFGRFLIVGFGEVDDGAFPSLAVGATSVLYEDLCLEARELPEAEALRRLNRYMPFGSRWRRHYDSRKTKP